jgi:hypothetical protein
MSDEFVERRRCADERERCPLLLEALENEEHKTQSWIKWFIGIALPVLVAIFAGIITHEQRLTGAEKDVKAIKEAMDANKIDTNQRLERIEEKQDKILFMLSERKR